MAARSSLEVSRGSLGGWCQTPVLRAVKMSLKKRACESPSPALGRTSATDLVPERRGFRTGKPRRHEKHQPPRAGDCLHHRAGLLPVSEHATTGHGAKRPGMQSLITARDAPQ